MGCERMQNRVSCLKSWCGLTTGQKLKQHFLPATKPSRFYAHLSNRDDFLHGFLTLALDLFEVPALRQKYSAVKGGLILRGWGQKNIEPVGEDLIGAGVYPRAFGQVGAGLDYVACSQDAGDSDSLRRRHHHRVRENRIRIGAQGQPRRAVENVRAGSRFWKKARRTIGGYGID